MAGIKLITVKANGKRFIFFSQDRNKIKVKGQVLSYSGASAVHGSDKTFLANRVDVHECDYSEQLVKELYEQDKDNV